MRSERHAGGDEHRQSHAAHEEASQRVPTKDACSRDVPALSTRRRVMSTARGGRCENRVRARPSRIDCEPAPRREEAGAAGEARRWASASGSLDDRFVFVVGSPRSGTTFLAGAIGALPGFVDLGEVAPVKAAVPELAALSPADAATRLRRILALSRRVGLVGAVRPVEQTPEMAFLVRAIPLAYPEARVVHIVRDGRDVVCSLLEKPWLRRAAGTHRRRRAFRTGPTRGSGSSRNAATSSSARATHAERRGSGEATSRRRARPTERSRSGTRTWPPTRRRSRQSSHPTSTCPSSRSGPRSARAHASSVGRYRTDLSAEQLADVEEESGALLRRARLRQLG